MDLVGGFSLGGGFSCVDLVGGFSLGVDLVGWI